MATSNNKVVLKADFEVTHQSTSVVRYELFYGSVLDLSSDLIFSLYEFQHVLKGRAKFIPRIKTFNCEFCPEQVIENQCTSDGRYCFYLPDQDEADDFPDIDPFHMLHENLR